MSDGIWVALISGLAVVLGPIALAYYNQRTAKSDRSLASKTVEMKNRELRMWKARYRRKELENRKLRLRRARRRRTRP